MLETHAIETGGPAILGSPQKCLAEDLKFANVEHVKSGEKLAQAALQIELLICEVAGVELLV